VKEHGVLSPAENALLDCLVSKHPGGLEDHQLADELGRGPKWKKFKSDIRTAVHRVRDNLRTFYKYDPLGKKSGSRLQIPDGTPYRVELVTNHQDLDPIERFWDPHFGNDAGNLIVYTEPLFFWDQEGRRYIRYLDLNDESSALDAARIREKIPAGHPARELQPCFHYHSGGETQAQRILRKWFEHQGNVEVKLSRECVERDVWKHNIVVLGNSRTNRFLKTLQEGLTFVLDEKKLTVQEHNHKSAYDCFDLQASLKEPSGSYLYATVTRRPSIVDQRWVTMIAANHGRAIEKLAESLTTPNALHQIYSRLPFDRSAPLPTYFQLLFRIQMIDYELAPGEPELVDSVIETYPKRTKIAR
jgi:hypothetical protein